MNSAKGKIKTRNPKGNATTELPVAMLVLILLIFLPMLDVVAIVAKYGMCYSLNVLQTNEAALLPASKATASSGPIKNEIPKNWKASGMGQFVDLDGSPETKVSYQASSDTAQDQYVTVSTKFVLKPFISVSATFLPAVPGLNAPVTFTLENTRPLENPANVKK